jgi:hypothetical protein
VQQPLQAVRRPGVAPGLVDIFAAQSAIEGAGPALRGPLPGRAAGERGADLPDLETAASELRFGTGPRVYSLGPGQAGKLRPQRIPAIAQ